MAVLEASWRPSWAILAVLEAISSHLGGFFPVVDVVSGPYGWPAGRAGAHWGSSFGKEPKPKPRGFSTPGTPVMNQQGAADLMAFGLSRHRAWVVGQSPQGCFLGSLRRALGGLQGGSFAAFGEPVGASWGPLGGLLGPLGGVSGLPGGGLGRGARKVGACPPSGARLEEFLGPSWAVLEASGPVLGASWAVSAPSWGPLRPSWGDLWGLLWCFGASGSRKGENAQILQKLMKKL